jgi:hypothetical protein
LYTTRRDSWTRNLNVTWVPMQPNNMTYLIVNRFPEMKVAFRFNEAGFWNYYWIKLWERRLSITPTPILKNALLSYQDSYILVWVFISISALLTTMLIGTCFIIFRKVKKDKFDEDDF